MSNEQQTAEQKLDAGDARCLVYFWEEKGDLERFTGWDKLQPLLEREHPEVVKAWRGYKTARKTLSAVLMQACEQAEDRE